MKDLDKASVIRLTVAVLAAVKLILEPFGLDFPQEVIDALANTAGAIFVVYAAWKNNYVSKKGKAQKATLQEKGLK